MTKKVICKCKDGTILSKTQGKKSERDFIVITEFPQNPHAHSLEYIGSCLRAKAEVEDINYPKFTNSKQESCPTCGLPIEIGGEKTGTLGKDWLFDFSRWCIYSKLTIKEICKKFKIPGF